jgi:hypothetical protein
MISVINLVKGAESSNFRSLSDFIFHPILGGRHGLDCRNFQNWTSFRRKKCLNKLLVNKDEHFAQKPTNIKAGKKLRC